MSTNTFIKYVILGIGAVLTGTVISKYIPQMEVWYEFDKIRLI